MNLEEWYFIVADFLLTSTNAAQQDIGLQITPGDGNILLLQSITLGPDNYAAGRTSNVFAKRADTSTYQTWIAESIDNVYRTAPPADLYVTSSVIASAIPSPGLAFAGDDYLLTFGAQLAQNETQTVTLRGWVKAPLTFAAVGTGAELTTSEVEYH